jgi:hypothetical protein
VSSPSLSDTPHRRRTGGSSGATPRGVRFDLGGGSQLAFWRQRWILDPVIFIFYFVRLPLCNKYSDYIVTFISIHSVIIYVVFFGTCMRCTRLCPLKPGCDNKGVTTRSRVAHLCEHYSFVSSIEPYRMEDALRDSDWVLTMQEELNNFTRNEVWHLVPCSNQNVVATKWVFRNKQDEHGVVTRNKA